MTMEHQAFEAVSLIYSVAMLVFEKVDFLPPQKKHQHDASKKIVGEAGFFSFTINARKKRVFQICAEELNISYLPLRLKLPVQVWEFGMGNKWANSIFANKNTEG